MKELFVPFFVLILCTFSALCHFVGYLFWTFSPWIMLLSSQKVFRVDPNHIKEMQINWEDFAIVKDKKFHVEIRVFLMTCRLDLVVLENYARM